MQILQKMHLSSEKLIWITERTFLGLLAFFLLWRGGKALDASWLLTGLAWLCTYHFWKTQPKSDSQLPFWLWALPIALLLWTVVSFALTSTANYGLDEVLRTGSLIAMFFWIGRLSTQETPERQVFFRRMFNVLASATLIACAIGIFVYILQPSNRLVGTFFDARSHKAYWPNAWAEYLLLAWPVLLWWLDDVLKTYATKWKLLSPAVLHTLIMGIVFGCMLLSYSRGGMLALIGQVILWVLLLVKKGKRDWVEYLPLIRRGGLMLLIALFCFVGINSVRSNFYQVESAAEKVTFTASEGKSSISERGQFWMQSVRLIEQKPLFGWGPYSFRFMQPRFQQDVLATSDHGHNVFLKLAMERGLPAAIALAVLLFGILLPVYWKWEGKPDVRIQGLPIVPVLMVSVVGVLAHNLIDYNLQFVGIALPFWLMLGMLSSLLYKKESSLSLRKIFLSAEIGLLTILLAIAIFETPFLIMTSFGRHAEVSGKDAIAERWYDISKKQGFSRDLHLSRTLIALRRSDPVDAHAALDMYFEQNMEDSRAWKLRGDTCRIQRDWECALKNYNKAYELGRYNDISILHAFVGTLRSAGEFDVLTERRHEFDSLMNDFGLAIALNSHFVALTPNVQELVLLTRIFEKLYPENEPQYAALGAEVMRKAAWEQERLKEEVSGYLW